MKKASLKWVLSATVAAAMLAACGGGGSDVVPATTNGTATVTSATSVALAGTPFTFPAGVPQFGTTASTDVSFTGSGATSEFAIGSGGNTASGPLTFGSCIFTIRASTFPSGHPLARGATVTVNPCNVTYNSAGYATGSQNIPTTLSLGTIRSSPSGRVVVVKADGGVAVGTLTITGSGS